MSAEDLFGIVGTTQAGNFHIERVVAQGGFGVVYRALHGGFRAPVAIKCLKIPDEMTKEQRDLFLEKFREEAELTFRLSAAIGEVCRPLHVDVLLLADGRFVPFLAMEWLEGESLDAIVTKRRQQGLPPLGLHKIVKMMRPVATALAKAHRFPGPEGAVAIIHRDLKPENLMFTSVAGNDALKILDFGIAKAKRAASQAAGRATGRSVAEDEAASFTPAYGAPEQWAPKSWGETGPWTDVWGLAISMVEALCGRPPIDGEPWVMRRMCLDEKRRPTPRNNGADVPVEVERVFEEALAVDPRKRFKTIEAFWSELEKAMGLPPSLGPRDDRREPDESERPPREEITQSEASRVQPPVSSSKQRALAAAAAEPSSSGVAAPRPAAPAGEKLARIELQRVAVAVPAAPPRPPKAPPPVATNVPPSASGNWEFDLGTGPAVPAPAVLAPAAPLAPREDVVISTAPVSPARPPAARHSSMELELPLPSRTEPPDPQAVSLEMSLPIAPQADLGEPPGPPALDSEVGAELGLEFTPLGAVLPPEAPEPLTPPPGDRGGTGKHRVPVVPPTSGASLSLDYEKPSIERAPSVAKAAPLADRSALPPRPAFARKSQARSARDRLIAPIAVLLTALVIAGGDSLWYRVTGDRLTLGPVRPYWIAAPLALIGVGLALWRLMEDHPDG